MPSWNIHTAHVERLLTEEASALGITDVNAFAFGNLAPDVYVGYMVPDCSHKIEYRETHFADPGYVPEPRFWEFWTTYALPSADAQGHVSGVVLGAWCHLMADHVYNHVFNAYIAQIGVGPGEQTRIRKQSDFDIYGRTHAISLVPEATPELIEQCATFPQYPILEEDVHAAIRAQGRIVENNRVNHVSAPVYDLISAELFARMEGEADALMRTSLEAYAHGGAQAAAAIGSPYAPAQ